MIANGTRTWLQVLCATSLAGVLLSPSKLAAQTGLQVTYGSKGVQRLAYNGVMLENVGANGSDSFHIWHMKSTDLIGNPISTGQYGWGESNNGTSWNAQTQTETYTFNWGSIATRFAQNGDNLDMIVTETNNAGSGILFDGAEIYPFALHFPTDPAKFSGYTQYAITTTGPGVSVADYGSGIVTSVIPNEAQATYGGWKTQGANTYTPLMTTTAPDGLATFLPHNDLPLQPGTSLTYTVSLRFTPEGTPANASDAYASFAATYPNQMTWSDRRIIGTAYLASSPAGTDITQSGGFPSNPRRYFNDASVNIYSPAGLLAFQQRMLAQAAENVSTARSLGSQGVITWDIEGEQFPQNTSYVCSPDQISGLAPEMESIVSDSTSAYFGRKLVDAYFKTMSDAGLRTGVCLRPQVFTLAGNGTASQSFLTGNAPVIANLEAKAKYSNARWGTTIFYVDSTVDSTGGTLDPAVFQQVATDLPGFLFIPEESTPRYYAYTAPFYSFLFKGDLGTAPEIYKVYPKAFGANLVNDVSAAALAQFQPQLTQSVSRGDILMGHADYWQANNPTLVSIYAAAGVGNSTPVQVSPAVSWPAPASISYGTALSGTQLNASASAAGTFTYAPPAGTVLNAGTSTLMATFTPTDTASYKSVTASTTLTVTQTVPTISWLAPAPIVQGTPLSATQLNATASVAGTFTYTPAAGSVPATGSTTLQVLFTPNDRVNFTTATASTTLAVTQVAKLTPALTWNAPATIQAGTALSAAQLNATANVAGNFQYTPGAGTVLGVGTQVLRVAFTPANATLYNPVSAVTTILVQPIVKTNPVLQWAAPGAIVYGTALSSAQLNATANVAGSFQYTPAAGTVLNLGATALQVTFTPQDTTDYNTATATVPLTVNALAVPASNLAILYPTAGSTVSGTILVQGYVNLPLDAAGSFLIVDGRGLDGHRVTGGPYLYALDTTTLPNGPHTLQLWAHDIGNNTTLSAPVQINVAN